jgi:hypothetical protein
MNRDKVTFVFAAIAQNCGKRLKRILSHIESFSFASPDSHCVIVENDSSDCTKKVLNDWRQKSVFHHVICLDGQVPRFESESSTAQQNGFDYSRIAKLAWLRNHYMVWIESLIKKPDYLIVFDGDLAKIKLEKAGLFLGQNDWDALTANGVSYRDTGKLWHQKIYYDTYALRRLNDQSPQTLKKIKVEQTNMINDLSHGKVQVLSAFSGLAIYKWKIIEGLRYGTSPNPDLFVPTLCEHEFIHKQMVEKRGARIFVQPELHVSYNDFKEIIKIYYKKLIKKSR